MFNGELVAQFIVPVSFFLILSCYCKCQLVRSFSLSSAASVSSSVQYTLLIWNSENYENGPLGFVLSGSTS
nr:hypothetical protein [Tanacetum cinerariifolium]